MERSENEKSYLHFKKTRGIHSGKRGFVVGNGPSLKLSDLDLLSGDISIGSNKVFFAFDKTQWRPSYYIVSSPLQTKLYGREFHKHFDTIYTRDDLHHIIKKGSSSVYGFKALDSTKDYPPEKRHFSFDFQEGAYSGFSVTYEAIQLAVHMGLNPIYLIGCDHHYHDQPHTPSPNTELVAATCNDHFIPGYRKPGETINPYMKEIVSNAFEHAKLACSEKGINIINATRGGKLEIFERVDFDTLF